MCRRCGKDDDSEQLVNKVEAVKVYRNYHAKRVQDIEESTLGKTVSDILIRNGLVYFWYKNSFVLSM